MPDSPLADVYIEANAKHMGGANGAITRVVIHGTVSPCQRGGARNNARYFQRVDAGGSAHYVTDPGESVQCVPEDRVAHHAPPNTGSIGIELTDEQNGDGERWSDADHEAMLQRAAALCRDVCVRNGVPLAWLSTDDLKNGAHGITGHVNVAQAWRKSDHTDPGADFPADRFMALVTGQPPAPSEDDELTGDQWKAIQGLINAVNDNDNGVLARVARIETAIGVSKDTVQTGLAGSLHKARVAIKRTFVAAGGKGDPEASA